jgi:outer membrane translocation and assembly module TamA
MVAPHFRIIQVLPAVAFVLAGASAPPQELCPSVTVVGEFHPGLSDLERRLICGDPEPELAPEGWRRLPPSQARYNFSNFLQARGYHHPAFSVQDGRLVVSPGEPTRIKALHLRGAPSTLHVERKRNVLGEIMTPERLTELEKWTQGRLKAAGFPCPKAEAEGDTATGTVTLPVQTGPQLPLVQVTTDRVDGLDPGVLRRHDAFTLGDPFNGDLLAITESRIISSGLVESSVFEPTCGPEGVTLRQEVVVGPSRLVSAGLGFSTEGLVQGRINWRNSRLDRSAHRVDLSAFASSREQRLDASLNWYVFEQSPRAFLQPLVALVRNSEVLFETLSFRSKFSFAKTWDFSPLAFRFRTGPALDLLRTYRGVGPRNSRFISLEAELAITSHKFEFWATSPRSGFGALAFVSLAHQGLISDTTVQRVSLRGEWLLNYGEYDPPVWVLGVRAGVGALLTDDRAGPDTMLPQQYLQYLGGSTDLRGWFRKELSGDGYGALTSAFVGAEGRWADLLPFGFQPIAFLDIGALGQLPFRLDSPVYVSPGAGLRWNSPIGVFRTTLAHGFPGHWQFFFSYGEEF